MSDSSVGGDVVAPDPAVIEQNTSGVVGVLAEALAQHDGGFLRKDGDWQCFCGAVEAVSTFPGALARHQASVVAALPNIAIVQLPDDDGETRIHGASALDGIYDLTVGVPRDRVSHRSLNDIASVESMEHLGLALLAAARAARAAGGQA